MLEYTHTSMLKMSFNTINFLSFTGGCERYLYPLKKNNKNDNTKSAQKQTLSQRRENARRDILRKKVVNLSQNHFALNLSKPRLTEKDF